MVPAGGLARDTATKLVDVPPLQEALPDPAQRSVIYAADGKTSLATLWLDENRKVVPLKDIPTGSATPSSRSRTTASSSTTASTSAASPGRP